MELHDKLVTTCLKVRSRSALAFALVTLGVTVGCTGGEAESTTYPPPPECDAGQLCGTTTGMGVSSSSGGQGGSGGAGQGVTVVGTLQRLNEPTFTTVQTYLDPATILVVGSGDSAEYTGMAPNTFTLMNVDQGHQWFFVRDNTAGVSGIFSTYSDYVVPDTTVPLPVIDSQNLTNIANSLPVTLESGKAHIIVKFSNNGMPLSGVSLTTQFTGATIAYDIGCGVYSTQETVTGTCGTMLILNFAAMSTDEYQAPDVMHPVFMTKTLGFYTKPDSATILEYVFQ